MAAGALPAAARGKRLALIACIAGSSVAFLDVFAVNVALPAIRSDLGGGLAAQQWVVNAYLLTLGALLLIGGSLGDLFGERRVFLIGAAAFGVTSLMCVFAPTIELLVAGRVLQGTAAALLVPSTLAVIVAVFEESERGAAIGSWTAWTGIATVAGPVLGGQLVDALSWRWVFAINVPLIAVTLVLAAVAIPPAAARRSRPRIDFAGAALVAAGLGSAMFALIEQPARGWGSSLVIGPLAGGLLALAAFVAWERRSSHPMMPPGLFARRNFLWGNVQTLCVYAGMAAMFFFLTIYLQQVAGYSAFAAGLASLPTTVVLFVLSRRFGAMSDRFGPRIFLTAGPIVAAVGMVLLLRVEAPFDYVGELLPALLVFAVGLAMTVAPLTATVLAGVEERRAGIASGVNNAVARVAELVGIAAIGVVVSGQFARAVDRELAARPLGSQAQAAVVEARTRPLTGGADSAGLGGVEREVVDDAIRAASASGFHAGMGVSGGLVALGGLLAAFGIRNPRRRVRARDCPGGALAGHPEDEAARGVGSRATRASCPG